jgi:hypothetical protein
VVEHAAMEKSPTGKPPRPHFAFAVGAVHLNRGYPVSPLGGFMGKSEGSIPRRLCA